MLNSFERELYAISEVIPKKCRKQIGKSIDSGGKSSVTSSFVRRYSKRITEIMKQYSLNQNFFRTRLSVARSQAVVDKLVIMGIAKDRLKAAGKGQTSPIADNNTNEGRAINRRVEFVKL